MHDVVSGEYFESLYDLSEIDQGLFLCEGTFFLHEFIEGTSVAELIDEVEVVSCFEHVNVLDYIRAGLKSRQDVDLVDCAFFKLRNLSKFFCLNNFDGDFLFGNHMDCFIDFGIDSLSKLFFKFVVLYDLSH
jgi:hypothetical protein